MPALLSKQFFEKSILPIQYFPVLCSCPIYFRVIRATNYNVTILERLPEGEKLRQSRLAKTFTA